MSLNVNQARYLASMLTLILCLVAAFAIRWLLISGGESAWRTNFDEKLSTAGRVKLGDLVTFYWDRIYFLGAYDLTEPLREEIFGTATGGYRENGDSNYWAIIYRIPNRPPFVIPVLRSKWRPLGIHKLWTASPNAMLMRSSSVDEQQKCYPPNSANLGRGDCLWLRD